MRLTVSYQIRYAAGRSAVARSWRRHMPAHAVDPDNPFAGLEVVEVLQTVEVTAGEPVTVTFP